MSGSNSDPTGRAGGPRADSTAGACSGVGRRPRVVHQDLGLRIDRNGVWYYLNSPIDRVALVRLFASVLERRDDGSYWLVTPAETGPVSVEDAPFLAVEITAAGEGRDRTIRLRTNIDEIVTVDEHHPLRVSLDANTGEPSPYVALAGRREARLTRAAYYDLVSLGAEEEIDGHRRFGVWSCGCFFALGEYDAADDSGAPATE